MRLTEFDFIVVGGGIIGLSTAWQLQSAAPKSRVLLLEKEQAFAQHQTGRNSGVIHAGIYYKPGSLKAKFCRAGLDATMRFCRENSIPFEQCGKLVVATSEDENAGSKHSTSGALRTACNSSWSTPQEFGNWNPM